MISRTQGEHDNNKNNTIGLSREKYKMWKDELFATLLSLHFINGFKRMNSYKDGAF